MSFGFFPELPWKRCRSMDGPFPMPVDTRVSNDLRLVSSMPQFTNTCIGSCVHLVPLKTQLYIGKIGMHASLNLVSRPAQKQQWPNPHPHVPQSSKRNIPASFFPGSHKLLTPLPPADHHLIPSGQRLGLLGVCSPRLLISPRRRIGGMLLPASHVRALF